MATLSALKNLGKSIASDIVDAKNAVAASIDRSRTERAVMRDFKALLREHPRAVTEAFAVIATPREKPARKPRAKRAEA